MSETTISTKNNQAWKQLFHLHRIPEMVEKDGVFEITSEEINRLREARLMTKFDHKINLPDIFKEYNLSILPITRGNYIISHIDAYKDIEEPDSKIYKIHFPDYIQSIDYTNINSESLAINCAYISGMLEDFLEEKPLHPTLSGRMSSGEFSFKIRSNRHGKDMKVDICNAQIEIDGGYESYTSLTIIESKNFISDDFIIRQLYYPFRLWGDKVIKPVRPVFMCYSNDIFSFYEYEFQDPFHYNSLILKKQKNYTVAGMEITIQDIKEVLNRVNTIPEPEIPFPQADNFKRVINLCELLSQGERSRDEITLNYAFDTRQTNYYTDAGRYLGLINKIQDKGVPFYSLSYIGKKMLRLNYQQRQLYLAELILQHKVFADILKLYFDNKRMPLRDEIVNIMKISDLYNINSDKTYYRRAGTVSGWINWILSLQNRTETGNKG